MITEPTGDNPNDVSNADVTSAVGGETTRAEAAEALDATKGTEAYTLTYDTLARTLPAATADAPSTTSAQNTTTVATDLTTSEALANALQVSYNAAQADIVDMTIEVNALIADDLSLRKIIAALITDLIASGVIEA